MGKNGADIMTYTIEAACGCSIGKIRANNEDNFYFDGRCLPVENRGMKRPVFLRKQLEKIFCCGIFDGMGGEDHGEVAAFTAAQTMKTEAKRLEEYIIPEKQFLENACDAMNQAVFDAAQNLGTDRMGSTAVLALFSPRQVYICNLGDSRAYRLRSGEFLQLSKDHTDREILKERGITDQRPRLTQHLGLNPEEIRIEPSIAKGELRTGDWYLLCSDGLTDMLSNFEISDLMHRSADAEACANALIRAALDKGGRDNITVVVCRITE